MTPADDELTLEQLIAQLHPDHRLNLGHILGLVDPAPTVNQLCEALGQRYRSRWRTTLGALGPAIWKRVPTTLTRSIPVATDPPELPSYPVLLLLLARKLGIKDAQWPASANAVESLEKQVIYTIIAQCLVNMTAEQRVQFFEATTDASAALTDGVTPSEIKAPLQMLSLLGLANTVGVPVYAAASTALGLVTHAMGLSLPVVAVAGVTSTVAFVIGPVGWLAAGGWLLWRVTGPDWRVLTQVMVYLISQRHPPPRSVS